MDSGQNGKSRERAERHDDNWNGKSTQFFDAILKEGTILNIYNRIEMNPLTSSFRYHCCKADGTQLREIASKTRMLSLKLPYLAARSEFQ